MKPIYIHKGDDTVFGQITKFLSFKIVTSDNLEDYKAEFRLRRIVKKVNSLQDNEFEVVLTAEETNKLDYGKCFGEIKLVDPEGHIKTFCNTIPFVITPKVVDSQEGEIEIELTNSPEYSLILKIGDNKAGVSNYADLKDKPQINGVELVGNLTTSDLKIDIDTSNLATKEELKEVEDKIPNVDNLATKEELKEVEDKIPDVDNLATKDEIPTVPTKLSDFENDSGFISDISGAIKGGKYVDVLEDTGEVLYEFTSAFTVENTGVITSKNVTSFTGDFPTILPSIDEFENPGDPSPIHAAKLKEEHLPLLVELTKADGTSYNFLECLTDDLFMMLGAPDLTEETKIAVLASLSDKLDPYTKAYAIPVYQPMGVDVTTPSEILLIVYQDTEGEYYCGIIAGWVAEPISRTPIGESTGGLIVDLNNDTAQKINKNTSDIESLNTRVDNLPNAEYTAGSGINISNNVISALPQISHVGEYDSTKIYKAGDIVRRYASSANGYLYFMSLVDGNLGNTPSVSIVLQPKWFCLSRSEPAVQESTDLVPIATIASDGSMGSSPSYWGLRVPTTTTNLNKLPKVNLYTGVIVAPSGIEGYYTAAEIDAKLGDVETLLSEV